MDTSACIFGPGYLDNIDLAQIRSLDMLTSGLRRPNTVNLPEIHSIGLAGSDLYR